jgi:hypothetical protein
LDDLTDRDPAFARQPGTNQEGQGAIAKPDVRRRCAESRNAAPLGELELAAP